MTYFRTLLLTLAGTSLVSCFNYDDEQPVNSEPMSTVNINIYVPKAVTVTRADEGTFPANDDEQALHKTYIWVYENVGGEDAAAVAFLDTDLSEVEPDNEGKYTVQVQLPVSTVLNKRNVDVFVVANVDAIPTAKVSDNLLSSIENKKSISRADLLNIAFGKATIGETNTDDFGVTTPTGAADITTNGLPMSEYILNQNIYTGNDINPSGVSLELKRAVSKIRFVFARITDFDGVSVTGITFNGNAIPVSEYAFPAHTASAGSTIERTPNLPASVAYETNSVSINASLGTEDIFESNTPQDLVFRALSTTETGTQYITRLDNAMQAALTGDNLTAAQTYGLTYFRESDMKLSGTVSYRLPGETTNRETTFEMAEENDFTRNHYYVVYGYFDHGKLVLTVTVQPWELQEATIEYSQTPSYAGEETWTANTYDETNSWNVIPEDANGIRTITLRPYTTAEYNFEITSPQGFSWIASFTSLSGNPQAFKFVHADNSLSDTFTGTVGTGPTTLRIKAATDSPSETSSAMLTLIVRQGEGKNIPLSKLSVYKIIQVAN